MCDERFIWNPSNCECECDKSCNIGEYLQSVTKIVRLAPPPLLFNVGCKFACSFLILAVWHGFFWLGTTLSQGEGGILGNFKQV